jgi:gamma-glutamylputrescine oxidase
VLISKSIPTFNPVAAKNFSYWERTSFIDGADVIVIGSGLVGLSAAMRLKLAQPALKVTVLERGFLPTGASTKNAGFACLGSVSEQVATLVRSSDDGLLALVDYRWRGLHRLRQNLGDNNIGYKQHGGYELLMKRDAKNQEYLDKIDYFNKLFAEVIGSPDIYATADAKIADFGFAGVDHLIYNAFEGQINTGKMMQALLAKVYSLGIVVLNNCDIQKVEPENNKYIVVTSQGNFTTSKVILATNAFAAQLFPELAVVPGRGQVLVTKPIPNLKIKGTFHFNEGYYYFRDVDNRILFGGGRNLDYQTEQTWEFGQTELIQNQLEKYLQEIILPDQPFEIDYSWSGIMGFGDEVLPIVKQLQPGLYCAVRCNGMGVAMGSLVGEEVADLVLSDL